MPTDTTLKNLKPKEAMYKVADRDGVYVVSPAGTITFRYDYRRNGRRKTLTIGRYGPSGVSLAKARERCIEARRAVTEGASPSQEKQRQKRRVAEAKTRQVGGGGAYGRQYALYASEHLGSRHPPRLSESASDRNHRKRSA